MRGRGGGNYFNHIGGSLSEIVNIAIILYFFKTVLEFPLIISKLSI